jgi:hypothetical protein
MWFHVRPMTQRPGAVAVRVACVVSVLGVSACSGEVQVSPGSPPPPPSFVQRFGSSTIDTMDLVLALDNSRSMADKQQILAEAVQDLVAGLLHPPCLAADGLPTAEQPDAPQDPCPVGSRRAFPPILDVHIGMITSSLGGHGADGCTVVPGKPETNSNNDSGHLVARLDAAGGADVPTYQEKKFLAWDPKQQLSPPGEGDPGTLIQNLRALVTGAGQSGCGYESQLESAYRFLVDPAPYETIAVGADGKIVTEGVDGALLQQRADFLRPDSLLAIVLLSDENDCSIKEHGQFYLAAQLNTSGGAYHLPKARAACASDPLSACCRSCGQPAGVDENGNACPEDPTCGLHDEGSDPANLRCFEQKRRFGIDFLYPTARYVEAFSSVTIQDRTGQLVPNPLFLDLDPTDTRSNIRDAGLVFVAGIVGVPWQDLARDPSDLTQGFRSHDELAAPNAEGVTGWDVILGDPESGVAPLDPHMRESVEPRAGKNPITGDVIAPPNAPNGTNAINGHEYTNAGRDDLQYACVFDLPEGRNCGTGSTEVSCDCQDPNNDNPLCEPNPDDLDASGLPRRTLQVRAKAYPGLRELAVLKGLGAQGIVGSVCPRQLTNPDAPDYGYRPAIGALVDRLTPNVSGSCFPRSLAPDEAGRVPCAFIEARVAPVCDCQGAARAPVPPEHAALLAAAAADPFVQTVGASCFCEVSQLAGDALAACQYDLADVPTVAGQAVDGWCYVDATTSPPTGDPALVSLCPESEQRILRLVGEGAPKSGAMLFFGCFGGE